MNPKYLSVPAAQRAQILSLGLPIMFAQFSQGLTSLVSTGMVAGLNDPAAMAAVGLGSYANFLATSCVLGFSVGVQTLVARRLGAGHGENTYQPLNAGITLAIGVGFVLSVLFYLFAPWLMTLFSSDPAVTTVAIEYFEYRCLGVMALGFNFCCRGFLNGSRRSRQDMAMLVTIQICNIALCYGLIFGAFGLPELGAPGAGLAASISLLLGSVLYFILTYWRQWHQLLAIPSRQDISRIARLGIPNSSQQFFVAMAMLVFYWLIGKIGTDQLAIAHVLTVIALFIVMPGNSFGTAVTTLVSHSLGAKKIEEAYHWCWYTLFTALPLMLLFIAPLWLFPEQILLYFFPNKPELLAQAYLPLQITSVIVILRVLTRILSQSLLGAGDAKRVMLCFAVLQWGVLLPVTATAALVFDAGIAVIWFIQLISWALHVAVFATLWQKRRWQTIQL